MSNPIIYTYNPKKIASQYEFYILCKGLNSGKPLEKPCPNSFVFKCNSQSQKQLYFTLIFALWKSKQFYQLHIGSVIPFIRINDFKTFVNSHYVGISSVKEKFLQTVQTVILLEQKEKQFKQNLLLIAEAKKALLYPFFKK